MEGISKETDKKRRKGSVISWLEEQTDWTMTASVMMSGKLLENYRSWHFK